MSDPTPAIEYAKAHQDAFLEALKDLLRIPSVSTLPENKPDMARAADWLVRRLEGLGFDHIEVIPTKRHPVVYGEHLKAGPDAPTILVYGHYDVQPTDPVELWETDPFEPTVRGDDLFARGASDMKGQIVAHLMAVESMINTNGLPVNLKYMIEGEEEIGSPNLEAFIEQHKDKLACDVCLNADAGILAADTPAITYGLRGLAYFELRLQGPDHDLHSGRFGGAVPNPGNALAKLIAGMHDEQGRVTLPGFYTKVRPLSDEERDELARLPEDEAWWKAQSGAEVLTGEIGYTPTERASARPTLDVNGLLCGFTGEGSKTVLPSKAMAKVSMRLVPDQSSADTETSLRHYLEEAMPAGISWELINLAGGEPAIIDVDSAAVKAAGRAFQKTWGKAPLFDREGGSVPVVGMIQQRLGVDSLMLGYGLPDDNLHAPNEKFHLPNYYRGIETYIYFTHEMVGG
jgi:acetylornithine deacetylase/succinyl-diaminopimelate desuccinylase-like protein